MRPAATILLAFAAASAALAGAPAAAKPAPGQKPVMRVVEGSIVPSRRPGSVLICARGLVSTGGWSAATLTPRVYVAPPANGIWEVDFTARPPVGIVPQVIRPIRAKRFWTAPG
ncbi:MAG TPA: hypothetical protein VEA60_05445, partial [Allosphingosinicella sp.]|nr:hypothetical protein [Allosphingosinicella sp.]